MVGDWSSDVCSSDLDGEAPERGTDAIEKWATGYVRRHPIASLTTVGDQFVLGVRTVQYLFTELFTGRFQ